MISAEEFLSGHEPVIADCEPETEQPERRAKETNLAAQGGAAGQPAQGAAGSSLRHAGSFGAQFGSVQPGGAQSGSTGSDAAGAADAGSGKAGHTYGAGSGTASSYGLHGAGRSSFGHSGFRDAHSRKPYGGTRRSRRRARNPDDTSLGAQSRERRVPDDPQSLDACREAALTLLDAAARPSGALRTRLLGKGYTSGVVEEVIERLSAVNLIDDRAYAQSAVRYCVGRMYGRRGTINELVRKGVERPLATEVVDVADKHGAFEESAWELGRSIEHKTRGLERQVRKRRLWSAGGRKGHDPAILQIVAHELFDIGTDVAADVATDDGANIAEHR
jgi:regulatory protein